MNTFTPDFKQVAYLRFYEEMKCRDIAKVLAIPTGTVKSRLHVVRAKLKKELETLYEN